MKNGITLRGDTSSQLDFNLAPQDIVLNCSDGQVRSTFANSIETSASKVETNSLLLAVISPFIRQLLRVYNYIMLGSFFMLIVTLKQYCRIIFFIDRIRRVGQVGQMENAGKLFCTSKNV